MPMYVYIGAGIDHYLIIHVNKHNLEHIFIRLI